MKRTDSLAVVAAAYDEQLAVRGTGPRPWGRALRRWHVVRRVVWEVVGRRWDRQVGPLPGRTAVPSRATRDHLRDLVEKAWDDIAALCRAGTSLSSAALADLAARGVLVPPGELSERVAVRMGAVYRERGLVPGPAELPELVADLVKSYLRGASTRLNRAQFQEGMGEYYEREWQRSGARHVEAFRPSSVGLGDDVQPPLAPATEHGGWYLGVGRSVWGRYRLYSIASAASKSSPPADATCQLHDEHERRRDLRAITQCELAQEEVRRVCSPYGLTTAAHQGVLLAISHGLDFAESVAGGWERTRSWQEWTATPCMPLASAIGPSAAASQPDLALVSAVRDFAGLWRASAAGEVLEGQYGPLPGRLDLIHTAVTRKTWMDLHRREREFVEPMRRAHVVRALRVAFCRAVPEALHRHRDGYEPGPRTGGRDQEVLDETRRNNTYEALLIYADEVASWHTMTLSGELSWFCRYEDIIAAAPEGASSCLPAAEFARILAQEWSDPV